MQDPGTDPLSPLAAKIIKAGSYDELVVTDEISSLARELLEHVTPDQLLSVPVTFFPAAYAMLAALWLRHDALDACHEIVRKSPENLQAAALNLHRKGSNPSLNVLSVETVENAKGADPQQLREMGETLAFWHAIMHRREGDFSNSKYWYARCGDHLILPAMGAAAQHLLNSMPADKPLLRLIATGWHPGAFVDLIEKVEDDPQDPRRAVAVSLQKLEWQLLFDHCVRQAVGR